MALNLQQDLKIFKQITKLVNFIPQLCLLCASLAVALAYEDESAQTAQSAPADYDDSTKSKRGVDLGSYSYDSTGFGASGLGAGLGDYGSAFGGHGVPISQTVTVNKPYAVPVIKQVAVPVPHAVHVPQPIPVAVPQPYAVPVPQPYPVVKTVTVPVDRPYPVPVYKQVPYAVPKPYAVHVPVYKHIHHYPKITVTRYSPKWSW